MKRLISASITLALCLCFLIATERRALAYVDPGTGYMALQGAGAFLIAAAFTVRRRILALFGKTQPAVKKNVTSVPGPVAVQKENSRNAA